MTDRTDLSSLTAHFSQLNKSHLTFDDIEGVLHELKTNAKIEMSVVGFSYQQRPIHLIRIGKGPTKVLAWTQMHGNEPTATAAVCDLLHLLVTEHFFPLATLLEQVSLYVVPMLNPDGAQAHTRENAQGIDINRDAQRRTSPEAQILSELVREIKPHIALNLHDQSRYYGVGNSDKPATIAMLAPPFNQANDIDVARQRAMQLIGLMASRIEPFIDGRIARYNDEFAPRCFGDSIASQGISTILIESGYYPNDPHRQMARSMNVLAIATVLESLFNPRTTLPNIDRYHLIPENRENAFADVILRNIWIDNDEQQPSFQTDIMFRQVPGEIAEVGDLGARHGFVDLTQPQWHISAGLAFNVQEPLMLTDEHYLHLLKEGFSHFIGAIERLSINTSMPVLCCHGGSHQLGPQEQDFALVREKGKVIGAILNSQWTDVL